MSFPLHELLPPGGAMSEVDDRPATRPRTRWAAIASLGAGAFVIVAAEFLPVGILPELAKHFGVSLGAASAVVLVPGLVAGVSAPLIVALVRNLDRRLLVLATTALLVASNLLTTVAPDFGVLLVARVLVGLSLGGFWAVGPSLGVRLAAPEKSGVATSVVLAGISAGTVLGLPLGQLVSASNGWQSAFLGAAVAAAAVLILQAITLPSLRGASAAVPLRAIAAVVARRRSRVVLIVTVLAITGQLMASTYVGAYLGAIHGSSTPLLSALLLTYGIVGLAGNLIAGRIRLSFPILFGSAAFALSVVLALLPFAESSPVAAIALVVAWGLLWGAYPFMLQSWTISLVPDAPEAGSAVLVTFLQLSIALGSAVGGLVISFGDLEAVFFGAAVLQLAAATTALTLGRRKNASPVRGTPEGPVAPPA
ncbi:MFS transporter [Curtobacterium sp. MCPF17_001]|nr:MFS transporter [Curtobacterium sp. MCPF17_001]